MMWNSRLRPLNEMKIFVVVFFFWLRGAIHNKDGGITEILSAK